jgi:glycosyltransferase involved in cell wall biosynthesis
MAQRIAKKLKAKFVFDVYDKYDEFSGYVKPLGFDLFGYLLKKADMRLFASHALLHSLGQPERDAILSNGLDANHFRPIDKAEARRKLQLPVDATYVGYFGSMEPDRGVQDLIDAVKILREQGQSIELLLGGKAHDSLQLDQPGIRYLGNVPFADVPYALAASDVLAIPYRRSPFMDAGASNKIAEAIACQRPIVATRSPNLTANFPQQAQELDPYLAEPSQPSSLAAALAQQLLDRKLVAAPQNIYWSGITSTLEQDLKRLNHDPA